MLPQLALQHDAHIRRMGTTSISARKSNKKSKEKKITEILGSVKLTKEDGRKGTGQNFVVTFCHEAVENCRDVL